MVYVEKYCTALNQQPIVEKHQAENITTKSIYLAENESVMMASTTTNAKKIHISKL